jgi:uncharacterized Fe-S cluster protein YjdI
VALSGASPVLCSKTALAAFTAIVEQGEGAPLHSDGSHYQRFIAIRCELAELEAKNAAFVPAFPAATNPVPPVIVDGVEHIEGKSLTLIYDGKKCIHARFCVTGAPTVFLANVEGPGPWIHPDAVVVDRLVEIAHACPSGAIRYGRKDGHADEPPPPVNLLVTREAGPYAVRGDIRLDGADEITRATLCRCGARARRGAGGFGAPLSLRRKQYQAVLRRHTRPHRVQDVAPPTSICGPPGVC